MNVFRTVSKINAQSLYADIAIFFTSYTDEVNSIIAANEHNIDVCQNVMLLN